MSADFILRPGGVPDLTAVARLHHRTRTASVPAMPAPVHDEARTLAWVRGWDLSAREVWIAESDDEGVLGYLSLTPTWLEHLYVDPSVQGQGIGAALLELAISQRPAGFGLWVFESNRPARAFYAKHGLVELERTDGSANEEQSPDIRVVWPGEQPLAFLRAQIDDVDTLLADLLARRVALTAAVQVRKPVGGHAGRNPAREQEIAERMAARVPALGSERMARIVDTIIAESLDASRG